MTLSFEEVFEKIKIYRPQKDDLIILKTSNSFTAPQVHSMREHFASFLPEPKPKIVILEDGWDIEILRKEER